MHIEPGIVDAAKISLSYATAAVSIGVAVKFVIDELRAGFNPLQMVGKMAICSALVFSFFEILPHFPVGVSEVHFILGSTLFLIFGAGPAAIGLAVGLGLQGIVFAPADLPQFGMNVTTLIAPLLAVSLLAKRVIPEHLAYKDIAYRQALTLSVAYQGGIVAWVAFWAFYGQGISVETLSSVATFGAAYLIVIVLEPVIDLAVLWSAKNVDSLKRSGLFQTRVYQAVA